MANLHVAMLSGISYYLADMVATIRVLQFPPIESLKIMVINDYL